MAVGLTPSSWPIEPGSERLSRAGRGWVDATPFRAHVAHLMAAAALSVEAVALLAGVHTKAVARLMAGGDNRRPAVRRISPDLARSLLRVSSSDVQALRCRLVGAQTVTGRARLLRSSGWSESRLAATLGVDRAALGKLLEGSSTTCTALVAVRAAAAMVIAGAAGSHEPLGAAISRHVA